MKERILVVDDEIEICEVLKEFLTIKGYDADTAFNGKTAIAKVKEMRPHVVLLDIKMPEMDGIQVLKEIKKIDPAVGVIMITAIGDEELAKKTLELGAYDFISKPVDFDYLEKVLLVRILQFLG